MGLYSLKHGRIQSFSIATAGREYTLIRLCNYRLLNAGSEPCLKIWDLSESSCSEVGLQRAGCDPVAMTITSSLVWMSAGAVLL